MAQVKKNGSHAHGTHAVVNAPHGESMDCPEAEKTGNAAETKTTPFDGKLSGTFGLEVLEETNVDLKDLRITGQPQISFGDPRVVAALSGEEDCHTSRTNTVHLEVPFE